MFRNVAYHRRKSRFIRVTTINAGTVTSRKRELAYLLKRRWLISRKFGKLNEWAKSYEIGGVLNSFIMIRRANELGFLLQVSESFCSLSNESVTVLWFVKIHVSGKTKKVLRSRHY